MVGLMQICGLIERLQQVKSVQFHLCRIQQNERDKVWCMFGFYIFGCVISTRRSSLGSDVKKILGIALALGIMLVLPTIKHITHTHGSGSAPRMSGEDRKQIGETRNEEGGEREREEKLREYLTKTRKIFKFTGKKT